MVITPERLAANKANSLKSCGPKTAEGKEVSRRNGLKHGLTGQGIVLANEDAAEVDAMASDLVEELKPKTRLGGILIRRAVIHAVRMERGALHETESLSQRVVEVQQEMAQEMKNDDPAERAEQVRSVGILISFDPTEEAKLARRYEAASEKGFYKAIKEFRLVEAAAAVDASPEPVEVCVPVASSCKEARPVVSPIPMVESTVELAPRINELPLQCPSSLPIRAVEEDPGTR